MKTYKPGRSVENVGYLTAMRLIAGLGSTQVSGNAADSQAFSTRSAFSCVRNSSVLAMS